MFVNTLENVPLRLSRSLNSIRRRRRSPFHAPPPVPISAIAGGRSRQGRHPARISRCPRTVMYDLSTSNASPTRRQRRIRGSPPPLPPLPLPRVLRGRRSAPRHGSAYSSAAPPNPTVPATPTHAASSATASSTAAAALAAAHATAVAYDGTSSAATPSTPPPTCSSAMALHKHDQCHPPKHQPNHQQR